MNTPNKSNTQTDLSLVLAKIAEIAKKSADSDYIYRGEPECYGKVSSSLYRKLEELGLPNPPIEDIQNTELMEAKRYINKTDDFEVLTEIQHFAGKTNLIDFTTDYRVALFFACERSPFEDGRVILQNKNGGMSEWIEAPRNPEPKSRPDVQKSIFLRPPNGFFQPTDDDIVIIPKDLKHSILKYLESKFHISAEVIYPDLHGFVTNQDLRWDAYIEFGKACAYDKKASETKDSKEKDKNYRKAIVHFTAAIKLMPEFPESYNNRGIIHNETSEYNAAIQDFTKAIEIQPDYADVYYNRGTAYGKIGEFDRAHRDFSKAVALNPKHANAYANRGLTYYHKGEFDRAIQDFSKAVALNPGHTNAYTNRVAAWLRLREWERAKGDLIVCKDLGIDIVTAFHNAYGSVADFGAQHGVKVPEDIAVLLRRD